MKLITVSGPPSSGKTSVVIRALEHLRAQGQRAGVVKFDCVSTLDETRYKASGIPVKVGLSGHICPDHFFVSNLFQCHQWGRTQGLDFLFTETAGLCNRCAPHIRNILAVCVIDNLSGMNTPWKIGPMLRLADLVVIAKSDLVSQAEKEVFLFRTKQVNPRGVIIHVNGLTGQGSAELASLFFKAKDVAGVNETKLRSSMPAAVCSYRVGQTTISDHFQMGNIKRMDLSEGNEDVQGEGL
ncbi:MAG: GTP-binding protein [Syntrophorhabdaceae bacterium]|nr:GTP-binding protein [Syntrophorhabdaceae bacterium]